VTSQRPCLPAGGRRCALHEIERGRGVSCDAGVVDACLQLFRERRFMFP
jgi:hypothetical protein